MGNVSLKFLETSLNLLYKKGTNIGVTSQLLFEDVF